MALTNPFSRDREGDGPRNVTMYKALTLGSFLLNLIFTIMYMSTGTTDKHHQHRHSIFGQSNHHVTPFTPSHVFISIYWIILFIGQIGFVWHLFSTNERHVQESSSVGSHFILFNLLQFAWVMLWTRDHFIWSELMLIVNFFQLCALYFRYSKTCRTIHIPAVTMPLSWTFLAIMWNGAVMVHCHSLACRILANVAIWSFLVYALFFLLIFKDYTIGFQTAFLMAGLGTGQFLTHVIALQWIFAFTIMSIVFIVTILIAIPSITGGQTGFEAGSHNHHTAGPDSERQALLQDE